MLRTKATLITVSILTAFVAIFLMAVKPPSPPPEPTSELITLGVESLEIANGVTLFPTATDVSDTKSLSLLSSILSDHQGGGLTLRYGFLSEEGTLTDSILKNMANITCPINAIGITCRVIPNQGLFFAMEITNNTGSTQTLTIQAWIQK